MPRLAAALSITNMMNPQLFFFHHSYGSCLRPPQFWRGVAATELEQEIRKGRLERKKEDRRKAAEKSAGVPTRSTPSYREVASDLFLHTFSVHGCRNLETATASTANVMNLIFPLFLPPLGRYEYQSKFLTAGPEMFAHFVSR